jgi:peptidoglycan/xylan/chitin deacetylase (PgdA/CDA1 family)
VFDDQRSDFERLILKLKKTGQFIDTGTCIQMLQGEKEIDRRYYHLSFDDGFRNIFTNALPILRKHEVPAILFVPSSLIESSWDKTQTYCLETTRYNSVIEMLRWDDLKEIVSLGYEIGSHTRTHARFSEISHNAALLEDELFGSKKELETNLGEECKYISWPYGRLTDADGVSLKTAKRAGYRACFGAYRGSIVPGQTDVFSIPRHHFEVQWPISHVEYFARGNMEVAS